MKHFNCNKMLQLCQEDFEKKEIFYENGGLAGDPQKERVKPA